MKTRKDRNDLYMRKKAIVIMMILSVILCMTAGICEGKTSLRITPGEEWSWKAGASNVFDGSIDLSAYEGREIIISMATDIPYEDTEEQDSHPVFTIFDNKRIQMLKQSNTVRCTPESGQSDVTFSGRFIMPEKQRVRRISFTFSITDESGKKTDIVSAVVDGGRNEGVFYIPADINTIIIIIICAAVIVWTAVMVKSLHQKKTARREK